jgi:hypothetical protein
MALSFKVKDMMRLVAELEELKMKFVKDQNFTDAGIVRETQKVFRDLIKEIEPPIDTPNNDQ